MGDMISRSENYNNWISELSMRYRTSQIKAAMKVNDEMLRFYWSLGKDMEMMKTEVKWGDHFYENLSNDLKKVLPDVKSFSPRNLLYMNQFYRMFPEVEITQQLVSQLEDPEITQQDVSQLGRQNMCKSKVRIRGKLSAYGNI